MLALVVVFRGRGGGRRREEVFARFVVLERLRVMGAGCRRRCRLALGFWLSVSSESSSLSLSDESSSEDSSASCCCFGCCVSSSDELSSYCSTTGVLLLLILGARDDAVDVGCMVSPSVVERVRVGVSREGGINSCEWGGVSCIFLFLSLFSKNFVCK